MRNSYFDGLMGAASKNIKGAPKHRGKFSKKFRPGLRSVEKHAKLWKKKTPQGTKTVSKQTAAKTTIQRPQQGTILRPGQPAPRRPPAMMRGIDPGLSNVELEDLAENPMMDRIGMHVHKQADGRLTGPEIQMSIEGDIVGQNPCCAQYCDTQGPYDPNNPDTIPDNQYTPNAMAWVAGQDIQIYSVNAMTGEYFPMSYPDGSPMMARLWLPAMDLSNFLVPIRQQWFTSVNGMSVQSKGPVGAVIPKSSPLWSPSTQSMEDFFAPKYGGTQFGWQNDGQGNWGYKLALAYNSGNVTDAVNAALSQAFMLNPNSPVAIYQGQGSGPKGPIDEWAIPWDINFASHNPTSSFIFLKMFLPGAENVGWTLMPADLQGVNSNFDPNNPPYGLPGLAWMDLNFLNNARLGAHGLPPGLVNSDGTLNGSALSSFSAASAAAESDPNQRAMWGWWRMLDLDPWNTNNAMLATIYDTTTNVHVGLSAVPAPPPSPSPYDPSYGGYPSVPYGGDPSLYGSYNSQYPGYSSGQSYYGDPGYGYGDPGYGPPDGGYMPPGTLEDQGAQLFDPNSYGLVDPSQLGPDFDASQDANQPDNYCLPGDDSMPGDTSSNDGVMGAAYNRGIAAPQAPKVMARPPSAQQMVNLPGLYPFPSQPGQCYGGMCSPMMQPDSQIDEEDLTHEGLEDMLDQDHNDIDFQDY